MTCHPQKQCLMYHDFVKIIGFNRIFERANMSLGTGESFWKSLLKSEGLLTCMSEVGQGCVV